MRPGLLGTPYAGRFPYEPRCRAIPGRTSLFGGYQSRWASLSSRNAGAGWCRVAVNGVLRSTSLPAFVPYVLCGCLFRIHVGIHHYRGYCTCPCGGPAQKPAVLEELYPLARRPGNNIAADCGTSLPRRRRQAPLPF